MSNREIKWKFKWIIKWCVSNIYYRIKVLDHVWVVSRSLIILNSALSIGRDASLSLNEMRIFFSTQNCVFFYVFLSCV